MSKLAHSCDETMRLIDIRRTWEEHGSDSLEMLCTGDVTVAEVTEALGRDIGQEYSNWIYFNVK